VTADVVGGLGACQLENVSRDALHTHGTRHAAITQHTEQQFPFGVGAVSASTPFVIIFEFSNFLRETL
jgi:hypothetical protein